MLLSAGVSSNTKISALGEHEVFRMEKSGTAAAAGEVVSLCRDRASVGLDFELLFDMPQTIARPDGLMANIERFIDAESADFHWGGRIAERNLEAWESLDDADGEAFERVEIIGFFCSRYYIATCVVDAERCVRGMLELHHFDSFEDAEQAFGGGGG